MILNLKNRFSPVAGSPSNLMTKLISPHLILDVAAYRDQVGDITAPGVRPSAQISSQQKLECILTTLIICHIDLGLSCAIAVFGARNKLTPQNLYLSCRYTSFGMAGPTTSAYVKLSNFHS